MTKIIAEVGCNHKGDLEIAKTLIYRARWYAEADVVKFQKRTVKELLTEEEYNAPHPVSHNSYGPSYGAHREYLEFSLEQHQELKDYCDEIGIEYSCSVWDMTSAKEIASLNPKMIKIPSPMNHKHDMIKWLCKNYQGDLHISMGMTTRAEETALVNLVSDMGRAKSLIIYNCTSGYPVDHKDLCLLEIQRMKDLWGSTVKAIGFSGHHLGIAMDVAAATLGAEYIERHFTLDRTWKGTDHAASLEPDGLRKLVRDIRALDLALRYKDQEILTVELEQRRKFRGDV
jgi:sialic acid synthase